ncbi:orotidine-5'-phosphate decarboxylase [Acidianus brierleyi]|uniref:Orotidine 5'-phosphate decarboxylase n=1 Tax=Acidianus brierleyi TaxID=41673 RepID=A0A2U9IFF7_9CREN|nr:orotidine-5'-phosphate decarboxylase [Acidianus brierleyi]AWR94771.1 orotidine-5'-phosphate decarboxylase [Acidianus brierleyi]
MNKIILALDEPLDYKILKDISSQVAGIKIGWPLILEQGLEGIKNILKNFDNNIIFDLKLADIDSTMIKITTHLKNLGDSFIVHAFVGYNESIRELKEFLDKENKKMYLVSSMSHKGWNDNFYPYIKEVIKMTNPYGLVAPATRPKILKTVKKDFPEKIIISPGIGAQGAKIGDALCNGANYEIIGRSIYNSKDPIGTILEFQKIQEERLNECKRAETR